MFEELLREMQKLQGRHQLFISMELDDKRFYDRECPNPECMGAFKVHFDDWTNKVSESQAFCPFCRHAARADHWHTDAQLEHRRNAARAEMSLLVQEALKRGVERSRPMHIDGPLRVSMTLAFNPGCIPDIIPAKASDALRQEFTCETCGCRYASLGASFFCPACGDNSAVSCFDNTLEIVRKTVGTLETLRGTLEPTVGADAARDATRQIREDQLARLIGAFERFSEAAFEKLANASQFPTKGNVFQRLDDASQLWQQATGKGYGDFLSAPELQRLRLLIQRRHVLSHRQGIVDQAYIAKSGDAAYAIGQRLVVRDRDVLELVELLGKLATQLRTLI